MQCRHQLLRDRGATHLLKAQHETLRMEQSPPEMAYREPETAQNTEHHAVGPIILPSLGTKARYLEPLPKRPIVRVIWAVAIPYTTSNYKTV